MLVSAAIGLAIALPVLPARALHTLPLQKVNYDLGETVGWPQEVALVAREYHALPAAQQARTTILTGNYGEAGALARYGAGQGLPTAYSGANNFWLWGPAARQRDRRRRDQRRSGLAPPRVRLGPAGRHLQQRPRRG